MEMMRNRRRSRIYILVVQLVFTVIIALTFLLFMEYRVKAIVTEVNGELIPVYFKNQEVVYGTYIEEPMDSAAFTYEKAMEEFVPIDCSLDAELQEYTWLMCKANNIDFALVMALMKQESSYNITVVSKSNDYGLMQINKFNHEWLSEKLGITDFLDAKQNIDAGVFILGNLFEKYEDTSKVLMAYNMGESNARKFWKEGIYESKYSQKIMKYQLEIKEELEAGIN